MNAEAVGQLVQVLEKTISPDQSELKAAQHFLESAAQTNLPELIRTLSDVLYQGGNSPVVRQQAGVQLKNFLHTNDESLRAQYEERWLAMPEEMRNYTKVNYRYRTVPIILPCPPPILHFLFLRYLLNSNSAGAWGIGDHLKG